MMCDAKRRNHATSSGRERELMGRCLAGLEVVRPVEAVQALLRRALRAACSCALAQSRKQTRLKPTAYTRAVQMEGTQEHHSQRCAPLAEIGWWWGAQDMQVLAATTRERLARPGSRAMMAGGQRRAGKVGWRGRQALWRGAERRGKRDRVELDAEVGQHACE
eukprot:2244387-Pleurochrysis_carterae.AAC.2